MRFKEWIKHNKDQERLTKEKRLEIARKKFRQGKVDREANKVWNKGETDAYAPSLSDDAKAVEDIKVAGRE